MSDVVTENPFNRHLSWEALEQDITPTEAFFCRNHNPYPTPPAGLDWAGHVLTVEGLAALAQVQHVVTLECAGNGRTEFAPVPKGTPWENRGLSTGQFQGVALQTLLQIFPPADGDRHLIFQGADRGSEGPYERSLSLQESIDHAAFIALRMNGEPLPLQHGAPFRLIVPRYYAMASVKWLERVQYSHAPSAGYFQVEDYIVVYPDSDVPPRPATVMRPKSMLVRPSQGDRLGGKVVFQGRAWSGETAVSGVDLRIGGPSGEQWLTASLGEDFGPFAWRGFSAEAALPPGQYTVLSVCRAGDQVQPLQAPWNSQGYENNSAHRVQFEVTES